MFDPAHFWDWIYVLAELATAAAFVLLFVIARRFGRGLRRPAVLAYVLANERRPLAAAALIAFCAGALTSAIRPAEPFVHDEFSYLLAGDTFAHGRLTNPVHPLWQHFETFHVLQQPSYQSKYPPAQGLFLAAGQLLTGRPIVGVWLSLALAGAALYWCLRAWTPRGWAFFGSLLPSIRFGSGLFLDDHWWSYWGGSFWGGAVALCGACLAFGAAARLLHGPRLRTSLLLGLGFAILASSRPFEGLIVAVFLTVLLLLGLGRKREWARLTRGMGPAAVVVAVSLCGLGYYNWRVTGSPLVPPYTAYADAYDVVPVFTFGELATPPEYHHETLREFHLGFMVEGFQAQKEGFGIEVADIRLLVAFFLGPMLGMLTLLGLLWRDRWLLYVLIVLGAAFASHSVTLSRIFLPHYFAAFTPALVLLTVRGLRVLATWRVRGSRIGVSVAKALVAATVVTFVLNVGLRMRQSPSDRFRAAIVRPRIIERLLTEGSRHVVLVRYAPHHNIHQEWVYNLSEIDEARIVWAREMGMTENQALLDYYHDRRAWLLEADVDPPRLSRYSFD